jgi:hypothetical protein
MTLLDLVWAKKMISATDCCNNRRFDFACRLWALKKYVPASCAVVSSGSGRRPGLNDARMKYLKASSMMSRSTILIPHNNKLRRIIPNPKAIYLANFIKTC